MGDLSGNLSRHEIACQCGCGFDTMDIKTVSLIQEYADFLKEKYDTKVIVDIRGGNRCKEHNEFVQKKYNPNYIQYSSKSRHMVADSVDIKYFVMIRGTKTQIDPKEVNEYFDKKYPDSLGLGIYHNRNHIDRRAEKARWDKTKS